MHCLLLYLWEFDYFFSATVHYWSLVMSWELRNIKETPACWRFSSVLYRQEKQTEKNGRNKMILKFCRSHSHRQIKFIMWHECPSIITGTSSWITEESYECTWKRLGIACVVSCVRPFFLCIVSHISCCAYLLSASWCMYQTTLMKKYWSLSLNVILNVEKLRFIHTC